MGIYARTLSKKYTFAVVAAAAIVTKDVEPWTVVGGNPAKVLKKRILKG